MLVGKTLFSQLLLADENESRDRRIYADFAQILIRQARKLYVNGATAVDLDATVYALDPTTIDLCLALFPGAPFRSTKAAVKLHTLIDLRGNIPSRDGSRLRRLRTPLRPASIRGFLLTRAKRTLTKFQIHWPIKKDAVGMTQQRATNVYWHEGDVTQADRNSLLGHRGATVWFTGLSGSGKSTVAVALERALYKQRRLSYRLDGDNVRLGINKNLGFSAEDRSENIRRIGEIAKLFVDAGVIVLSSFVSPYRADRDLVRKLHEDAGMVFIEIFVDVPLEEAERRDPKGLYKKARAGEIRNLTGISDPYEAPEAADLVLPSHRMSIEEEVGAVIALLIARRIIQD